MAATTDQTSYPALLVTASSAQEKNTLNATDDEAPLISPGLAEDEKHFQVGGPLWVGVYLCLLHCLMGIVASSCSHVPYGGESPVWLRTTILIFSVAGGLCDHLGAYIVNPSRLEALRDKVIVPGGSFLLVFFVADLYTVLPAWEAHVLMFIFVLLVVLPLVVYKKTTGKEPASAYNDLVESFRTWSGVAVHLAGDTMICIWFVSCWALMGYPRMMGWLE